MAKRFIDTNIFKKSFFRGLSAPKKLLWIYLFCDCSHAGIWEIDLEVAGIFLGFKMSMKDLEIFAERIMIFDNGRKLFIPEFIEFQYGVLKPNNNAHLAVIRDLTKYNLINENLQISNNETIEPLTRGCLAPMDMELDKDKDKDKVIISWKKSFEVYKNELDKAAKEIITPEYIQERERFHPNLDIRLTLEKAYTDYWKLEAGWKHKKASKFNEIDWRATFNNSLTQKMNQVFKNNQNGTTKKSLQPSEFKINNPSFTKVPLREEI